MRIYKLGRLLSNYTTKIYPNVTRISRNYSLKSLNKYKVKIVKYATPATVSLIPLSVYKQDKPRKPLSAKILATIPAAVFANDTDIYAEGTHNQEAPNVFVRCYHYIVEAVLYALRFARILITFVPVVVLLPPTFFISHESYYLWRWRKLLLATLESLGPTFIKVVYPYHN